MSQTFEIPVEDITSLEQLFRTRFLDISRILELFDSKRASEFKKVNTAFMLDHQNNHDHGDGHGCASHSAVNKYYMPKERMTVVDKIIKEKLFESRTFFTADQHRHMKGVLAQINEAYKHILEKGQARGMADSLDEAVRQKVMTKCIHESLNRYIFAEVRKELVKMEQAQVVQPMLLANPQALKVNVKEGAEGDEMLDAEEIRCR